MEGITNAILSILFINMAISCSVDDSPISNNQKQTDSDFFINAFIEGEEETNNTAFFLFAELRTFIVNSFYSLNLGASVPKEPNTENGENLEGDFILENHIIKHIYNQPETSGLGNLKAFFGFRNVNLSDNISKNLFMTDTKHRVSSLQTTEQTENTFQSKFIEIIQKSIANHDLIITEGEVFLNYM